MRQRPSWLKVSPQLHLFHSFIDHRLVMPFPHHTSLHTLALPCLWWPWIVPFLSAFHDMYGVLCHRCSPSRPAAPASPCLARCFLICDSDFFHFFLLFSFFFAYLSPFFLFLSSCVLVLFRLSGSFFYVFFRFVSLRSVCLNSFFMSFLCLFSFSFACLFHSFISFFISSRSPFHIFLLSFFCHLIVLPHLSYFFFPFFATLSFSLSDLIPSLSSSLVSHFPPFIWFLWHPGSLLLGISSFANGRLPACPPLTPYIRYMVSMVDMHRIRFYIFITATCI